MTCEDVDMLYIIGGYVSKKEKEDLEKERMKQKAKMRR